MAISPQRLTIYLYSAHRAVIFAIAQLSCSTLCCLRSFAVDFFARGPYTHCCRALTLVLARLSCYIVGLMYQKRM